MDHGVKVASVLASSFSRRCSYIAESDRHVKEKAVQFGFVLGKFRGDCETPRVQVSTCTAVFRVYPLSYSALQSEPNRQNAGESQSKLVPCPIRNLTQWIPKRTSSNRQTVAVKESCLFQEGSCLMQAGTEMQKRCFCRVCSCVHYTMRCCTGIEL